MERSGTTAQRLPEQDSGQGWPYAFRIADFNGDGRLDFTVAVNHYPVENAPIYLDDGNGVYREVPFSAGAQLFGIVDANGDGHPDIFSTFPGGGGGPEQHFVQLEIVEPTAPRNLHAVARHDGIHLTWSAVSGATSYQIRRATGRTAPRLIGVAATTHYNDRNSRLRTTYSYSVQARNRAGSSPASTAVSAKRL
jgi:FG-GAP-like repeat